MTDPRAALAVLIDCYNASLPVAEVEAAALQKRLAERGVLLVTEAMLAAALDRWMDGDVPDGWATDIFAALSGKATEPRPDNRLLDYMDYIQEAHDKGRESGEATE